MEFVKRIFIATISGSVMMLALHLIERLNDRSITNGKSPTLALSVADDIAEDLKHFANVRLKSNCEYRGALGDFERAPSKFAARFEKRNLTGRFTFIGRAPDWEDSHWEIQLASQPLNPKHAVQFRHPSGQVIFIEIVVAAKRFQVVDPEMLRNQNGDSVIQLLSSFPDYALAKRTKHNDAIKQIEAALTETFTNRERNFPGTPQPLSQIQ